MGILSRDWGWKWGTPRRWQIAHDLPRFLGKSWAAHVSTKWPHYIANRDWELPKFLVKLRVGGGGPNDTENGNPNPRLRLEMGDPQKMTGCPLFTHILGKSWEIHVSP